MNAAVPPLRWVTPPRQTRSHRTLARILDAAEAMFTERGYERTTVSEIAKAAGSSVGAFYARFPDKGALLRCVLDRFLEQAVATIDDVGRAERWEAVPTRLVLRAALRFLIASYRERRLLVAAFSLQHDSQLQLSGFTVRISDVVTERTLALLAARGEPAALKRREVGFCVWTILSTLEARSLRGFDDGSPLTDDELADQATEMFARYLDLP
jgi:AcrR family transcriptional regulator